MLNDAKKITATCGGCGRTVAARFGKDGMTVNLPRGWRRIGGEMLCGDQNRGGQRVAGCISRRYYVRTFRAQIVGLDETDNDGRTMEEFRAALSLAGRESARYGNWLVQQLWRADPAVELPPGEWPKTKTGNAKLPPLAVVDAYRPDLFPALSGATISALAQMVRGWYTERRFEVLASLNRSVENYRFGFLPIEVRAADWKIAERGGHYIFRRVTVGPGKSWAVRVYCDPRNLRHLKACANGQAVPLAMKLVRRSKEPFAGAKKTKAWFCRCAALLPRSAPRRSHVETTLTLGHDAESLLFGTIDNGATFEVPGHDLRKLIVGGDRADKKRQVDHSLYRGIMPRRKLKRWRRDRTLMAANRRRKIDFLLHCAAAALVRWCASQKVTSVTYEITDRGFVPHFPWRKLRDYVACGLEAAGIGLHVAGTEPAGDGSDLELGSVALAEPGHDTT